MQEMQVQSLGQEDPRTREWQPTIVFLPGEFLGQRNLEGYSPWGCKESDRTEWLTLTCFLRNLYAGQEATVKTAHETMDWFQIGKGVHQGCILSPCLLNLHAQYITWNAGLDEAQAGIKIAGRNINNFRYAGDTTLMAESKEELKRLLMRWKRRVKKLA